MHVHCTISCYNHSTERERERDCHTFLSLCQFHILSCFNVNLLMIKKLMHLLMQHKCIVFLGDGKYQKDSMNQHKDKNLCHNELLMTIFFLYANFNNKNSKSKYISLDSLKVLSTNVRNRK